MLEKNERSMISSVRNKLILNVYKFNRQTDTLVAGYQRGLWPVKPASVFTVSPKERKGIERKGPTP